MARRTARVEKLGLLDEAVSSLTERPTRTALTCLGTVLGVGVLISVLGLTATASSQIDSRFTALAATEVTISQLPDGVEARSMAFPPDFEARAMGLEGVQSAGLAWSVAPELAPVSNPALADAVRTGSPVDVMAVSPGAWRVAAALVDQGRIYDGFAQQRGARVAVVGPSVASNFGIASLAGEPTLDIGGVSFEVVGVIADVERHPELLNAVAVPTSAATRLWGDPTGELASGWLQVAPGAGSVIAAQIVVATSPRYPERFQVIPPPDPKFLRGSINGDLQALFLVLAVVCLIVGMVGIANTTFVTVMERLGEIGLRRSLGAKRSHIATQFLVEAAVIGLMGGLAGAVLGLAVVVSVALSKGWTAVISPELLVLGPGIGAATALLAALYPAWRAAATEPVTALKMGAN